MKAVSFVALAAILTCPALTSCTTLHAGTPVKAAFQEEESSWAVRYIPGLRTLSNLIPPPTDARIKWDNWQKGKDRQWEGVERLP
jgi:hypothetical protein